MKTLDEKLANLSISACSDEPIHRPAFIQSFGCLIVIGDNNLLTHVSENICEFLGINVDSTLGQNYLINKSLELLEPIVNGKVDTLVINVNRLTLNAKKIKSCTDACAIELTPLSNLKDNIDEAVVKFQTGESLLNYYDTFDELHKSIIKEVLHSIDCDRVMIYEFDDDWHGEVVAEHCSFAMETYLGLKFPASDIPPQARALYLKNPVRYIADVNDDEVEIICKKYVNQVDLSSTDIRGTSPFHIKYLRNMGVRGSISISIIIKGKLWGLVSCHRYNNPFDLNLIDRINLKRISQYISLAIERQLDYFENELQQMVELIFNDHNLHSFLKNTEDRHLITRCILTCLKADGLMLVRGKQFFSEGITPEVSPFKLLDYFDSTSENRFFDSVSSMQLAGKWKENNLAGLAILPIIKSSSHENTFSLLLFRLEEVNTVNWGGKIDQKQGKHGDAIIDLLPRKSFSQWQEIRDDASAKWTNKDCLLANQLVHRLREGVLTIFQKEHTEREQLIENSIEIGLWSLDLSENYLYWNDGMFTIYGIEVNEFNHTYEEWKNCLSKEDALRIPLLFEQCLQQQTPFEASFIINNPKTGSRYIKAQAKYLYAENGQVNKVIGSNIDITNEIEMQNKMLEQKKISIEANKLASIGELAASIGHEINNPLAIINNNLHMAETLVENNNILNTSSIEVLRGRLQHSKTASERIKKIVMGLRTLARGTEHNEIEINVQEACQELVNMLEPLYRIDNVAINLSLPNEAIYIKGDLTQLQQVFINLLSNARDAVIESSNKVIDLKAYIYDNEVYFEFSDSGCGIPDSKLGAIFETFYTSKPLGKGTGIGLSVVKSIIHSMGGKIEVKSELNQGTTFIIRLPSIKPTEVMEYTSKDTVTAATNKIIPDNIKSCLIVDDEEALREIIAEELEMEGLQVKQAKNGEQALILLSEHNFDILITDSNMPNITGKELLEKLVEHNTESMPLRFLMTGDVSQEIDSINQEKKLVDHILFKPFNIEEVIAIIKNIN